MTHRLPLVGVSLLLAASVSAQTAGTCAPGTATADLASNDVRAALYASSRLFWNGSGNVYNVPRAPAEVPARPNAVFAAALWVGGLVDGQLRMSATNYGPSELWPGPLTAQGTLPNPSDCTPYDRIFRITRADLDAYAASGATTADLREWPVAWGAPVIDGDGIAGNYDLAAGDRPQVLGTETAWWGMNDVGNAKRETGTAPIGLEVRVAAFAMPSVDLAVDRATLYRYTLVNRSTKPLTDAYAGLWVDADLGNATDDHMGSDSARSLAYVYNGDGIDEGSDGYGTPPPAIGLRLVEGPLVDAPGQTWTDPDGTAHPNRRRLPLTGALFHESSSNYNGTPRSGVATDWYNALQSRWQNGVPIRACGNGATTARSTCPTTAFLYSGDPVTQQGWSERNVDPGTGPPVSNAPSDRHMIGSVGPFTLAPGEAQSVTFALVYARGMSNLHSVETLRHASDRVQTTWRTGAYHRGTDGSAPADPVDVPAPVRPSNGAGAVGARVLLEWTALGGDPLYEVQLSHDPTFPDARTQTHTTPVSEVSVQPDGSGAPYFWRVRGLRGSAGAGPWSPAWAFSTGEAGVGGLDRPTMDEPRPNPARGRVVVPVGMPAAAEARVEVLDVLGRRVAVVHDGPLAQGWNGMAVETGGFAAGVYVVRLVTVGGVLSRPLVVAR